MHILPENYLDLDESTCIERIRAHKARLGERLVILAHLYQRKEIVELGDFCGDSLKLARDAAEQKKAEYIVFCGVHFMAESARILAEAHQTVILPHQDAGCPMADMATGAEAERVWREIANGLDGEVVIPVTYVNSSAEVKAFCGRNGGIGCTSGNAAAIFDWALARGDKVLFLPDEHLGRNTANARGMKADELILWDPYLDRGGNELEAIEKARVILWKGFCHVHQAFTVEQIERVRQQHPGVKVVVHPECRQEVVAAADASGSTSFIVDYVDKADPETPIAIGTEINLVSALADRYPERSILELSRSMCPNMYKINPKNLLWVLDRLGEVNVITVPEAVAADARKALERMLSVS